MNKKTIKKLFKKYKKYSIGIVVGVVALLLVGVGLYAQNSSRIGVEDSIILSTSPSPTFKTLSEIPSPTQIPDTYTYISPVPTISLTPTPTSLLTTGKMRLRYLNKDNNNPIQANGGRIEVKANDGSYDFGKDNVVEETVGELNPTKYTIIMREPEGYTYDLFSVDDGGGESFGSKYCNVQWEVKAGRMTEVTCWVKKN